MPLQFQHFDTRLNQWIYTNDGKNPPSILTEILDNTLLEFYFPDAKFSFGHIDDYSTSKDLENHPDGHILLLSSKTRLLYGSQECLEVIEKLCPDRKDRGAYGSIFLGACNRAINEELNILIVDDSTGENGGILHNKEAYKLVGDCYGQISTELYNSLTSRESQIVKDYHVVQHRFGWTDLDGDDTKYRFGKGTLRPYKLENVKYVDNKNEPKIDLIIPISSFKGTDKDNPAGPSKPQIKPGLYRQKIWLGEKAQSQKGKTAISQLLASFPQGIKDFAEELEAQAEKLASIQSDPRKVAHKYVEDRLAPDSENLEGIIVVNDEDHKRIIKRIEDLDAQRIKHNEVNPLETESERQARDFDGDCIGVALASKYPNFTAEAEYRNLPQNAYAPTVKLKKQSFYLEDGTQPPFEEIAIHMSDSISVGVINNHVTALEVLESEIEILKIYGTQAAQSNYLDQVSSFYAALFEQENYKHPKPIKEEYKFYMQEFVKLAQMERTSEVIHQAMEVNRQMYRKMIEFGCYQNQIAVDLFKSAKTPDMDLIKENKRYLYRDVNYIKDKKSRLAYLNSGITPTGLSPVELLISQTNQYFQQSQLESRPIVQFQDLFTGVEFTPQQKFTVIAAKHRFDQKFNLARSWEQRRLTEVGPYCIIETPQGAKLEITNLTRYGHPRIWKANKLNISLEEIPEKFRSNTKPHELLAVAQIDDEIGDDGKPAYRKLGTVSQQSKNDYNLKPGMTTQGAKLLELKPELTTGQTKLLFREAYTLAEEFYRFVLEEERLALAAAAWNISASRQDDVEVARKQNDYSPSKKVSNFVFAAFPIEIVSRLEKLQFTNLKLVTLNNEANQFKDKTWNPEEKHSLEIRASHHPPGHERHVSRLVFVQDSDGIQKEFAMLEPRTGMLPIGTVAQASVFSGESYTANATVSLPTGSAEVTIREISKFSHAAKVFNAESVTLEFGSVPVPDQTVKIKLDGQTLGELDSDSIEQLKAFNYLENSKLLNLKLLSISETGNQAFVLGLSPSGNLLKINKINFYDFSGQTFDDLDYRKVTIEMPPSKTRDAVFLNGEPLGVLHFKKDKDSLKQLGLLKPGQLTPAPAILQSNFSHTFVKIDPKNIEYPLLWTKDFQYDDRSNVDPVQKSMINASLPILQKIKERPTFLFTVPEDEKLLGMAVDNHKVETVTNWLKSQNVEFSQRPVENVIRETHKGLAVFNLVKTSLPPVTEEKMISKFGQVINSRSDYLQKVKSLPPRSPPVAIEQQVDQQSIPLNLETLPEKQKIEASPLKENYPVVTNNDLQNWYLVADKLGKSEQYKQRVLEIAATFKEGQQLSPQALTAMNQDIQEHLYLSRLTQIAQRITTVLGESTENGSAHQVKGKIYDIYFNPERRDLIISEKNGSVILDVHSGKVQINNVSHEVTQNFEQANIKVEQALLKVKSNHMEL